jgi:hypothetical protein
LGEYSRNLLSGSMHRYSLDHLCCSC